MSVETPANGDSDTESQAAEAWERSKQLEHAILTQLFEIVFPYIRSGIDHSTAAINAHYDSLAIVKDSQLTYGNITMICEAAH